MAHFDGVNPWPIVDFVGIVNEIDYLFGGSGVDAREAADAFEEVTVSAGEICGPTAAIAVIAGVTAGGVAQTRECPFGFFVSVPGDRSRIVFFAGVFLEVGLEREEGREPAAKKNREYRDAGAHFLLMPISIACRPEGPCENGTTGEWQRPSRDREGAFVMDHSGPSKANEDALGGSNGLNGLERVFDRAFPLPGIGLRI